MASALVPIAYGDSLIGSREDVAMALPHDELHSEIRASVRAYPEEFVRAMSAAGWLGMLIPEA